MVLWREVDGFRFESATGVVLDQGYLPNDWFQMGLDYPWGAGADTCSTDASYELVPGGLGSVAGVTAWAWSAS
jgi:hypothetical protein